MNLILILGPIGNFLVGILSIITWKLKKNIRIKYFVLGGIVWVLAIIPKIIMDITVTSKLNYLTMKMLGLPAFFIVIGLYIGLRTGIFECGFTYLAIAKSKLKEATFNEIIAFGIGFGAFEAILISIPSIIQFIVFIINPSVINVIPETQRRIIEIQLNMPSWIIPAPIIERIFTLIIHVFTVALIFVSIIRKEIRYFIFAFLIKSILDGMIPYFKWLFKPNISPSGMYLTEIWIVIIGLISLICIFHVKSRIGNMVYRYE